MSTPTTVVVLCGHHSGSSMLAGTLHRMGCEMMDTESPPEVGGIHPKGMWERKEFEVINDRILRLAGGDWRRPPPVEKIMEVGLDDEMRGLLDKHNHKQIWGWKDPRNALTVGLWHKHISNPRYLVIFRPWHSFIDSYLYEKYRWKFGFLKMREEARRFADEYYGRINSFTSDIDRNTYRYYLYDSILERPQFYLESIANFVGGLTVTREALEMADSSLRHF